MGIHLLPPGRQGGLELLPLRTSVERLNPCPEIIPMAKYMEHGNMDFFLNNKCNQPRGGLAHRETGRIPGGPLLQEVYRTPGRTREFISSIISSN